MIRLRAAASVALVVAAACGGGSSHTPPPRSSGPLTPSATTSTALPTSLPSITLQAFLAEAPGTWQVMATIPFGTGAGRLAFRPSSESGTVEPSSFAIGPDGSTWILDPGKGRIAHFSARGAYVGEITGLAPTAEDLAFVGERLFVIEDQHGVLASVDAAGGVHRTTVGDPGHPISLLQLVPASGVLLALVGGLTGAGPGAAFASVSEDDAALRQAPGLPIPRDVTVDVRSGTSGPNGQEMDLRYQGPGGLSVQPLRVILRAGGPGSRELPAVISPQEFTLLDGDLYVVVAISASQPSDAAQGGKWLLRTGGADAALLWERLPDPGVDDDQQTRHLAAGPGGALYAMVLGPEGVRILRRP